MKQFNPCIIGYVPPPTYGFPAAFITNLQRFATKYPLVLFSDHADQYAAAKVPLPMIPILNPEQQKGATYKHGEKNGWSVNNIIFLTALRIAQRGGYSHILYLEEDCRVNQHNWDAVMFDEFVAKSGEQRDECVGGSVVCFGPYNYTRLAAIKWEALVARNVKRNFPIPTYGSGGSLEEFEPIVLVNGALGIYPMDLMEKLFDLNNTAATAAEITAWDFAIGQRMWKIWKEATFDHVLLIESSFSTYGNRLTTELERQAMLTTGLDIGDGRVMKVVAAHQFKSEWAGPLPAEAKPTGNLDTTLTAPVINAPPIDPKSVIVASGEQPALTPAAGAVVPLPAVGVKVATPNSEAAGATAQTRVATAEQVVSDKQAPALAAEPAAKPLQLRVDILIVTHAPHSKWLALALASIGKYCRGFGGITVVFPKAHMDSIHPVLEEPMTNPDFPFDITPIVYDEVEGKGHLHHMVQKCLADVHCPDADVILHTDSDCIFFKPTTPEDYFHSGKPVLLMTPYDTIKERNRGHYGWKAVTEALLKEPVHYSTMERHPAVHWRELYPALRSFVEVRQGMKFQDYVLATSPVFPYGFCEFTALGAMALRTRDFVDRYHWINTVRQARPEDHLIQFWTHGAIDEPQKAPDHLPPKYRVEPDGTIVPRAIINDILEIK